ncbi:MAG: TonB-dependent receptor [Acidobacteria bacterium]|nr:TonB-dependent receptor [Acidobacteriota bacterium]
MYRLKAWGVLLIVLTFSASVAAQTYQGRLLGNVTDKSGGVVKSAKVTITNVDTGVSRALETNEAGNYVAPNLPPGMYKITVEATGFKKVERFGVRLEVAKDADIDFVLVPGDITESIKVTEEAPLVETTNDTLGGTFANKAINDLPLNGRDFQNLVVLRPGVQRTPGGGFLSISSNGNRPENNNFIFDGTDNNDPYYGTTVINAEGVQGTPGTILPIDAIQEFNAQENPPAEYGWKPGAIVNLGIKSGTNDIHGTASLFERNNALDARNFFNAEPDPQKALRQHQFGASLGGPIRKNKTFLFGAYEGVRGLVSNSNGVTTPATVPLPGGDPANSIPDAIAALAALGIPVNPLSRNLLGTGAFTGNGLFPGLFPVNNGTDPRDPTLINTGFPNANRMDAFIVKADHHISDRHNITGRYFFGDSLQQEQDFTVLRAEWRSQSQLRAQVVGANYTWTPSSRWVNELKFGYNRFWQAILTVDHDKNPVSTYGINTGVTDPVNFGMPTIVISGFNQLGGNSGWPLLTVPNETYQFSDNVSWTRGRHTVRFGGEFRQGKTDNLRNRRGKGRIRFLGDGAFEGSTPLEDFLAGFPARGDIFVGNSQRNVSIHSFGAFFQDDWRITPRLTINAGVRYDLHSPIRERRNRLGNFDPAIGLIQVGVNSNSPYNVDANNVAPRLGIAWDVFGNAKTVIRAGAGIIYEIPILAIFLGQNGVNNATTPGLNVIPTGAVGSNLFGSGGNIVAGAFTARPSSGLTWGTTGTIFPISSATLDCSANPCDILGVRRDLRTPYVLTWNLNVQQALTKSMSLQVGYVANRGVQLYSIRDINQLDAATGTTPFGTRFPFLGYINMLENGYTSDYHGLQVTATQRAWHGLGYVLGYTWSHSIDFVSLHRAAQPQDSFHPARERGNSDNDIRHRFTLSLTYDLPGIKSWGQLLEGWQMNSIVVLQSGTPWTATDFNNDPSGVAEFSDRWNINGDPSRLQFSISSPIPCTNSSGDSALVGGVCTAYANGLLTMPAGTFGNLGRNTFRGPDLRNWDFSIAKTTRVNERLNIQLRAEFFNILNHPNFANPQSTSLITVGNALDAPGSFGLVNFTPDVSGANPVIGTGGPRNIQIGLKFRF